MKNSKLNAFKLIVTVTVLESLNLTPVKMFTHVYACVPSGPAVDGYVPVLPKIAHVW